MSVEMEELGLWMALNAAPGIGPARFHQILKGFRSLDQAFGATAAGLAEKVSGLSPAQAAAVLNSVAVFDSGAEFERMQRLGARILRFCDEEYPASLLPLYAPAPLLYVRGMLPSTLARSVAVVGTRSPTDYGIAQCRALVKGLAAAGVQVISGLAKGIDARAHSAALEFSTATFGILGSGLASFYPAENKALAERMVAEGGGVLSQFSMDAAPEKHRFPMRNGLISGLSSGVLVIEGEEDSGSLITAEWALEQGRDIYAVPGPVDARYSLGPNRLIQQGAKLVLNAEDVLAEFPELKSRPLPKRSRQAELFPELAPPREALSGEELKIFNALATGRMALDQLAAKTGMAPANLSAALTMLEIKGAVRQLPGTLVEAL